MIRLVKKYNPNTYEYDKYLNNHITGVKRTWQEILKPAMAESFDLSSETLQEISDVVAMHDNSKFDDEEYYPYLNYFYPSEDCPADEDAFDLAWNRHQKMNPHHWQYWILIRDEGEVVCLDMPLKYIVEMLCDWHSFTLRNPSSTAYKWWHDNKDAIIVTQETARKIDELVEFLKEPLTERSEYTV